MSATKYVCGICQSIFSPRRERTPVRFCSAHCRNTNNARVSAAKRGDMQRGKGCKTYVKEDGRHQHRIVAERMLGRPLKKGEIVHHVDGNKKNNDPSNLKIMTQRQHMIEHGVGLPGVTPAHKPWEARWGK